MGLKLKWSDCLTVIIVLCRFERTELLFAYPAKITPLPPTHPPPPPIPILALIQYQNTGFQKLETSSLCDTSATAELIFNIIFRQFLCVKCPKPVKIQFLGISHYQKTERNFSS